MIFEQHTAIYTDNNSKKSEFSRNLLSQVLPEQLGFLKGLNGGYFSNEALADFLEEEARHLRSNLTDNPRRELRSFSSGERKKALLRFLMQQNPNFLILDDPYDNLDREYQSLLRKEFSTLQENTIIIQLVSRPEDLLPFIKQSAFLAGTILTGYPDYKPQPASDLLSESLRIPKSPDKQQELPEELISMHDINLSYGDKAILQKINWTISKGDFWELRGPNGSGKSTLITLITGDNPKGFGLDLFLFGSQKGSGESVWDIKSLIGYFTPAMADRFRGYHSLENMLISGLNDSIGLYIKPGDAQRALAIDWLVLLGMEHLKDTLFCDLTAGQQRLIFCARAMIKHPPLLILDEPTSGLDPESAARVVLLINKMAQESDTAIIFVSHRDEPNLQAKFIFELIPGAEGSIGKVHIRS
jgi:molybdate transport system ATP-binding protein